MEEVRRGLELARRISDSPGPQRTSSPKPRSSPYASPSITPPGSRRPSHDLSLPLAVRPTPKSPVDVPDCAICASPMEDPAVGGGCAHHFCLPCYKEWAARKASCPTCRAPVWSLVVDVEYAKMCGAEVTQSQAKTKTKLVGDDNDDSAEAEQGQPGCRTVPVDYPAGMTIGNSNRGGCLVVKVVKGNGAHRAGIRAGDVLVKVNGTEVRDHTTAIGWIDQRGRVGDCEITYRPDPLRSQATSLFRAVTSPFVSAPSVHQHRRLGNRRGSPLVPSTASVEEEDEEEQTSPPHSPLPSPPSSRFAA